MFARVSLSLFASIILIHMTGHFSLYENNTGAMGLLQVLSTFTIFFPEVGENIPSAVRCVLVLAAGSGPQKKKKSSFV